MPVREKGAGNWIPLPTGLQAGDMLVLVTGETVIVGSDRWRQLTEDLAHGNR